MKATRRALAAAILALAGAFPTTEALATEVRPIEFERHEVALGGAGRLTVLTGFFLGGARAELAAVGVAEDGSRHVHLYSFGDGRWTPKLEARLRPEVLLVDVAAIDGRDRLITYGDGRLSWFDPDAATERSLASVAWSFRATDGARVPRVDIARDLNGDGRDDFVLPDVDGFWIAIQADDGAFSEAVKIGPPEPFADSPVGNLDARESGAGGAKTYGEVGITAATAPVYLRRLHGVDWDQDGKGDLVFWDEGGFEVHRQDERGQFDPVGESFAVDLGIDGEGAYARAFDYRDGGVLSAVLGFGAKSERKVLHSVRDIDGDGVADLVALTLTGRSITRQRSRYEVHLGRPSPGGTVFAADADSAFEPRGRAGAMQPWGYASQRFEDLDGDGRDDLVLSDVRVGLGGMLRALVGNSVPIDLELYHNDDRAHPDEPTVRRKIRRFAPFAGLGNVFFPPVLTGDVNGDGRSDLLVGHSPRELRIFLGEPGPSLLARRPQKLRVALPYDERNTRLVDLDGDAKQDLLIHHVPTDRAPDEPQRVTLLLAR